MFASLPEIIQKRILHYLSEDNFIEAKRLHDEWIKNQPAKAKLPRDNFDLFLAIDRSNLIQ